MGISEISQGMRVIANDDQCVGFVSRPLPGNALRITTMAEGCGYDHLIPLSWVSVVDACVFVDKPSDYLVAHWQNAMEAPLARADRRSQESA